MIDEIVIKKNEYRDSVLLMAISEEIRSIYGIEEVAIMMGTENNKDLIKEVGFKDINICNANTNDLIICIRGVNKQVVKEAILKIEEMLISKSFLMVSEEVYPTLESALINTPDANLTIISVPGQFAFREAKKALQRGLNVFLFSDNMPIEEEIELKRLALKLNRIVMGPDCGTAIINHVPLGFANVTNPGHIGLVAASGSGLQEVVCLIDRLGEGISHAIGTGGRDLSDKIGGISMLKGIDILEDDENTHVIVLISKPPGSKTLKKILKRISECSKKVIINFLGIDSSMIEVSGAIAAKTLEEAALLAVATLRNEAYQMEDFTIPKLELNRMIYEESKRMVPNQKYVRGLYSGGTLCYEAMIILSSLIGEVYSNIPLKPELNLKDIKRGQMNCCIDLGDDYFTKGKPHPMISPEIRKQYILRETEDQEVAVLLLDIILGYGAHIDMAGALSDTIRTAKSKIENRGGYLAVVTSVCGTMRDPQDFVSQTKKLLEAGAIVMPSNSQAARFAAMLIKRSHQNNKKGLK
jgi:FdrA protein